MSLKNLALQCSIDYIVRWDFSLLAFVSDLKVRSFLESSAKANFRLSKRTRSWHRSILSLLIASALILGAISMVHPVVAGGDTGMYPGDSVQTGYSAGYTGSGSISEVTVDIESLPSLSLNSHIFFMLDTGDLISCSGFMQDVAEWVPITGWQENYMNGNSNCDSASDSTQASPAIASGDEAVEEIYQASSSTTTYYTADLSNGGAGSETTSSISTWGDNSWQTMTEYMGISGSVPSLDYEYGQFVAGGTIYDVGGPSTSLSGTITGLSEGPYSGACATNTFNLGSWSNTIYGYNEPSFTVEGQCTNNYESSGTVGGGVISDPTWAAGTPNGDEAELRGPNLGDGANVTVDFGQSVDSGDLCLFGYSDNNGNGAYDSTVVVSTSPDDTTWTTLTTTTISPSSTNNPTWINLGSVGSSYEYVNVTAVDNNNLSANFYLGAVAASC
jgi:hypothetical protein